MGRQRNNGGNWAGPGNNGGNGKGQGGGNVDDGTGIWTGGNGNGPPIKGAWGAEWAETEVGTWSNQQAGGEARLV